MLTSFWLCLIAWIKESASCREEGYAFNAFASVAVRAHSPLCLLCDQTCSAMVVGREALKEFEKEPRNFEMISCPTWYVPAEAPICEKTCGSRAFAGFLPKQR